MSDHFWKLRCRKSARRCGAKHIWKSKCAKHTRFGPLLAVEMSKKCTPLWREAHLEVKMCKTHQLRTTFWKLRCRKSARRCGAKHISKSKCTKHHTFAPRFGGSDVEKVHAVVVRSTFRSQNVQNTDMFAPLLEVRMLKKVATPLWREAHFQVKCTKHQGFGPLLEVQMSLRRFASLHYTTLHYTTLHYTTLHFTTLHSTTLQLQLHN